MLTVKQDRHRLPFRGAVVRLRIVSCLALTLNCAWRPAPADELWRDRSPHRSAHATVNGTRLHYLDWGGTGDTLLLLGGMGASAHVFDDLAPQFTDRFRVLALTRRGHGESDWPEKGYEIGTLVEDLRGFLDGLKVDRAILAGHSVAGEEMTRFAGLYPDRVAGLIYLDAAYDRGGLLRRPRPAGVPDPLPPQPRPPMPDERDPSSLAFREWFRSAIHPFWTPAVEADVRATMFRNGKLHPGEPVAPGLPAELMRSVAASPLDYTRVRAPILSVYATVEQHPRLPKDADAATREAAQRYVALVLQPSKRGQIELLKQAQPDCRILELPGAHHLVFIDREREVVRAMRDFLLRRRGRP